MSALPSTCTLYQGDCLEVIPTLAPKSVGMVFADLPYRTPTRKSTDCKWDNQFDMQRFFSLLWPVVGHGSIVATATQPFASMVVMSAFKQFRHDIIWDKVSPTGHFHAKRAPMRQHEHVLVFCAKQSPYYPQLTQGAPYTRSAKGRPSSPAFLDRSQRGSKKGLRLDTVNTGFRYPISIFKAGRGPQRGLHPTQKPIALLEWLIRSYTEKGDTVLDPVFGSATTAVACARLGRNFIGIEKDPGYFEIGTRRVNEEREKLELEPAVVVQ